MAIVEKSVLIERSAKHMYDLVDRIEDYPAFLPWCGGTELLERNESITSARIHISYHGLKAHISTENAKEYPHKMTLKLREGPFRHLDGLWRFTPLGDAACKVEFRLHYEFSSKLLEKVLGPVFSHIAGSFIESFVKRARHG